MARSSIEMHQYRQILMRLRQGDSDREISRSGLMGRAKAACFRELAREKGWLKLTRPLPPDAEIAAVLVPPRLPVSAQSTLAAYRPLPSSAGSTRPSPAWRSTLRSSARSVPSGASCRPTPRCASPSSRGRRPRLTSAPAPSSSIRPPASFAAPGLP